MGGEKDDFFEENEESIEQEAHEEENAVEEEAPSKEAARLQSLEDKIERLLAMNAAKGNESASTVDTKPKLTKEQLKALQENPEMLVEILDSHAKKVTQDVQGQLQQSHWDTKAYKDFPSLNNDKKFESLVTKEIQTLVATGAMSKDHPQLLYHAARLASANYKPASGGNSQVKRPQNAMAPNSRQKPGQTNTDPSDVRKLPEYQYLKMAWNDDEKIKKAIATHKRRDIETKTDPMTGKTRRILTLSRRGGR